MQKIHAELMYLAIQYLAKYNTVFYYVYLHWYLLLFLYFTWSSVSYKALCKRGKILVTLFFFKKKDKEKYLSAYVMVKTVAEFRNGTSRYICVSH